MTRRTPLVTLLAMACIAFLTPTSRAQRATVIIDAGSAGKPISPDLFGIFFEDLNYAADGGLYAELIQNRSFEYSPTEQPDWNPLKFWELQKRGDADGSITVNEMRPIHENNPHYTLLTVRKPGGGVGLANGGFDGIPLRAGETYEASFWAYQAFMNEMWGRDSSVEGRPMPVTLRLESKNGEVLAEASMQVVGRQWQRLNATLTPTRTVNDARFVLLAIAKGGIALDMISLFPGKTFRNRHNGLRADLAQALADLKPKFVRFPGGCLVHGGGIRRYYDWKETVGPLEQRRARRNSWGYHQTMGLGYFEFFQFCEDIGAKPLPVVTAGVCCQHAGSSPGHGQEGLPMEEMPAYIQDVLDLIEWANGPATSKWGAKRADAGHPESFGLKYLGVGNEDAITPIFKERFKMIYEVLKEKHPEITVIGTVGPFASGRDFDNGWAFAKELKLPMVDEHYYVSPQWFRDNLSRYDKYDRNSVRVYVGEYAAHELDRRTTLRSALAEAAYMTGLERNGDVVRMASYAPLLGKIGNTQWNPDLIYFTNITVSPTINYYVQQLFSRNQGDHYLPTTVDDPARCANIALSSVRDSTTGDLILKLVNSSSTPTPLRIKVSGMPNLATKATRTVLTGPPMAVNSLENPKPLMPETADIAVGPSFDHELPAHSLTVIRIKTR
ncbi:MAG: alpha-L-arabinofuranosidase C-terminal domain-containing protein [Bacillota bacterium]